KCHQVIYAFFGYLFEKSNSHSNVVTQLCLCTCSSYFCYCNCFLNLPIHFCLPSCALVFKTRPTLPTAVTGQSTLEDASEHVGPSGPFIHVLQRPRHQLRILFDNLAEQSGKDKLLSVPIVQRKMTVTLLKAVELGRECRKLSDSFTIRSAVIRVEDYEADK